MLRLLGRRWQRRCSTTSIEKKYQRMGPREHVLRRPEVYIGSMASSVMSLGAYNHATGRIEQRSIEVIPALYKLYDEILVNAADNHTRDDDKHLMTYINIDINDNGVIRIENDGAALPVVLHPTENMLLPELLFGNLLTSSNYDDASERFTGGRHGYGAKLVNIFSTRFDVDIYDGDRGLHFHQRHSDNMSTQSTPVVEQRARSCDESQSWTRIDFKLDLERFGLDRLGDDLVSLMQRRAADMALCHPTLKIRLNGDEVKVPSLKAYMCMHDGIVKKDTFTTQLDSRWQIGVTASSKGQFTQTSFVNSVATLSGGSHVEMIVAQIRTHLANAFARKHKNLSMKPSRIRDFINVFVVSNIVNPSFDSQSKNVLTTTLTHSHGGRISERNLKAIESDTTILERMAESARQRNVTVMRKSDGRKIRQIVVPKLEDANMAGGKDSSKCCLILTEGDSAKALAISGLSVIGRDLFGVYALRGKVLNVREATQQQILRNREFLALKQILGLQTGRVYTDVSQLRYGKIMIMADQDHDGSHIKGLILNMIHWGWPDLLRFPGFLTQFVTPIVRCRNRKGTKERKFFTIPEYDSWRRTHPDWKVKYYKGLGTSTAAEAKEYFSALVSHRVLFNFSSDRKVDDNLIDLCFKAERANDRKSWLAAIKADTHADYSKGFVSLADFVNKELILYSMADNIRSIPSIIDGLKPGQRKIMFACFKRNLVQEIKVSQLAGFVAEHTSYHHGEISLCQTIVGLAQQYVGSNNINLLVPSGQFGTRHCAGRDAASPRYIYTYLSQCARALFRPEDNALLTHHVDDDCNIEPRFFVPVIPLILVNGSIGIGTGWSSSVPNHSPANVIAYVRARLSGGQPVADFMPWYRGFIGDISDQRRSSLHVSGKLRIINPHTVEIDELPIRKSTEVYKSFLDSLLLNGSLIKSYRANHTDNSVRFTIELLEPAPSEEKLIRLLRLKTFLSRSNMVLFDVQGALRRYETIGEILEEYFDLRQMMYRRRKESLVKSLEDSLNLMSNRARFVESVVNETLVIRGQRKAKLVEAMDTAKYRQRDGSYDYLLTMPILSMSSECLEAIRKDFKTERAKLDKLIATAHNQLWLDDLDRLEVALKEQSKGDKAAASTKPIVISS